MSTWRTRVLDRGVLWRTAVASSPAWNMKPPSPVAPPSQPPRQDEGAHDFGRVRFVVRVRHTATIAQTACDRTPIRSGGNPRRPVCRWQGDQRAKRDG